MKVYILTKAIPGHAQGTLVRVDDGEDGCYIANQYYTPSDILSFCITECPHISKLIYQE